MDLNKGTVNVLISNEELAGRRAALEAEGGYKYPASQTPWQEIQRSVVGQLNTGAILEGAEKYQRIAQTMRSEEHTSELQSLMRLSYAVFCWKKKNIYH